MDDVAAYGYVTPLKVKIVLALALTDAVVRDADVIMVGPFSLSPLMQRVDARSVDLQSHAHGPLPSRLEPVFEARRRR